LRLLGEGVSPDIQDEWAFTPLHYAAFSNQTPLIAILCDGGADVEARTSIQHEHFPGFTPLHCTIDAECFEAAAELIRCGANLDAANLDAANAHGETVLRLAVETSGGYTLRSPRMARLFIEAGADINAMDKAAWTIWEEASKVLELSPGDREAREIVELLSQKGAW
jgi:ankyrin repeat protein